MVNRRFFSSLNIKGALRVTIGAALMLSAVGYLAYQLSSLETTVGRVVAVDIPGMQDTLKDSAAKTDALSASMDGLTRRINEELMRDLDALGEDSKRNAEAINGLSQKIDTLSRQYVNFLKVAEDKITVSVPPRWVDELPRREGTIFSVGVSPLADKLSRAQQSAVEEALAGMSQMLERKTFSAVGYTFRAAGKEPPARFGDLSPEFRKSVAGAIHELLEDFQIENYWVDPAGYVYALISLPVKEGMENSQLGMLMETLKLTQLSITDALKKDFEKNLRLELLR